MSEQPNVQARKKAARKTNNAAPEMPQPQVQTIQAVVVPVEIFDQMKRAVKRQPYEDVELLLQAMRNLMPQAVNMQLPPGGMPPGM